MTDHAILCDELTATWHRDIPLAAAMSIGVASFDGRTLAARAPLPPNRNIHGTAFAGSLYSICVLTGWGAIWLALREQALNGLIVVAASDIQYRKGVAGDLVCSCTPDASALQSGLELFRTTRRMSIELGCTIDSGDKRAVTFKGKYVVHAPHA